MKRTLIAGILGGVIAFVWGAIAHMNPLTETLGLSMMNEKEDAVLDERSPTRFALERAGPAYFPNVRVQRVTTRTGEGAVQHASLIFHGFDFLPPLQAFYQPVKRGPLALAA